MKYNKFEMNLKGKGMGGNYMLCMYITYMIMII